MTRGRIAPQMLAALNIQMSLNNREVRDRAATSDRLARDWNTMSWSSRERLESDGGSMTVDESASPRAEFIDGSMMGSDSDRRGG